MSGRSGVLVVAATVLGALGFGSVLGACGGKSSSESATTTTIAATTTTAKATTTTTAASAGATTLRPTPTPEGMVPWSVSPSDFFKAVVGERYSFVCPAAGEASYTVWGVGPYTDDSSICTAAVHAGLITVATGGTVTFVMQPGAESYEGSTANGVTARNYGTWPTQFSFVE